MSQVLNQEPSLNVTNTHTLLHYESRETGFSYSKDVWRREDLSSADSLNNPLYFVVVVVTMLVVMVVSLDSPGWPPFQDPPVLTSRGLI